MARTCLLILKLKAESDGRFAPVIPRVRSFLDAIGIAKLAAITLPELFVSRLRPASAPLEVFEIPLAAITDVEVRAVKSDEGHIAAVALYFGSSIEQRPS